jgi:glycosyltransferase involved in cell wall biosynthesis
MGFIEVAWIPKYGGTFVLKIALSTLCENPERKTGLTSLFHEFVKYGLKEESDVEWLIFAGPDQEWEVGNDDPRVKVVRKYAANNKLVKRLAAEHLFVGATARQAGADVLMTTGFVPRRTGGLPVVMQLLTLHFLDPVGNGMGWMKARYRKNAVLNGLDRAALIITNTKSAESQILGCAPSVKSKLVQSYEGLQRETFHPSAPKNERSDLLERFGVEPGYLFWCSNFYPYKQVDKFLAAYAELSREERRRLPVVMVGGGNWGEGIDEAMEIAKTLGVREHINHFGWVADADLPMLYRQAKMFCLASREETFGRCVLEAMACGTPCVVNGIPVMEEVTNGSALIVDFSNRREACDAFRRLLEDEALAEKLSREGIEQSKGFDFSILARERIGAIRAMLTARNN